MSTLLLPSKGCKHTAGSSARALGGVEGGGGAKDCWWENINEGAPSRGACAAWLLKYDICRGSCQLLERQGGSAHGASSIALVSKSTQVINGSSMIGPAYEKELLAETLDAYISGTTSGCLLHPSGPLLGLQRKMRTHNGGYRPFRTCLAQRYFCGYLMTQRSRTMALVIVRGGPRRTYAVACAARKLGVQGWWKQKCLVLYAASVVPGSRRVEPRAMGKRASEIKMMVPKSNPGSREVGQYEAAGEVNVTVAGCDLREQLAPQSG
jgi:hypothetical protein